MVINHVKFSEDPLIHFGDTLVYCAHKFLSPAFLAGDNVLPASVCLFVRLLPTYLKNWLTYFNYFLQVWSLKQGENKGIATPF